MFVEELNFFGQDLEDEYAFDFYSEGNEDEEDNEDDENYLQTLSNINYDLYEQQQQILVNLYSKRTLGRLWIFEL